MSALSISLFWNKTDIFLSNKRREKKRSLFPLMQLKFSIMCKIRLGISWEQSWLKQTGNSLNSLYEVNYKIPNEKPFWLGSMYAETQDNRRKAFMLSQPQDKSELNFKLKFWFGWLVVFQNRILYPSAIRGQRNTTQNFQSRYSYQVLRSSIHNIKEFALY